MPSSAIISEKQKTDLEKSSEVLILHPQNDPFTTF